MSSGKKYLGPLGMLLDIKDIRPDPFSLPVDLAGNLLFRQKDSFRPPDIDVKISFLHPLNRSANQICLAVFKLIIDIIPFSIANLLDDYLLCRLGADSPKIGIEFDAQAVPSLHLTVQFYCLYK